MWDLILNTKVMGKCEICSKEITQGVRCVNCKLSPVNKEDIKLWYNDNRTVLLGCLHDHRPVANPNGWLSCSCGHPCKWNSGLYYKYHLIEVLRKNGLL